MTSIIERVEREELKQELAEIVEKLDPIPSKMTNNYLKATDINNFDNYKSVMTHFKIKKQLPTADAKLTSFYSAANASPMNETRFNQTGGFGKPMFGKLISHKDLLGTPFMNQRILNQRISTAQFAETPKPSSGDFKL